MVEAPDSRSASLSSSAPPPRILVSPVHLAPDLGGELDPPNFDLGPSASGVNPPTSVSEPVTINVAYEPEGEDMSSDLMTGFRRRMRKRLYEPIDVVALATKKSCPEESCDPPADEVPPAPVPPPDIAGSSSASHAVPPVREETQPTQDPALAYLAPADSSPVNPPLAPEERDRKDKSPCADPPTWEEMKEMLEQTSCFTDPELPLTKMSDFFPPTVQLSANMGVTPLSLLNPDFRLALQNQQSPVSSRFRSARLGRPRKW